MGDGLEAATRVNTLGSEVKARGWEAGWGREEIGVVAKFVVDNIARLKDATLLLLIKAMVPQAAVAADDVMALLGVLQVLSHKVREALLQWIVLVFDALDDYDALHDLYGVFFHYLSYDNLRPYASHILALLTRREDVLPFRVRKVVDLYKRMSAKKEPPLIALLMVYKDYAPQLVPLARPYAFVPAFKAPPASWLAAVRHVQSMRDPAEIQAASLAALAALPHASRAQSKRALESFSTPAAPNTTSAPSSSSTVATGGKRRGRKKQKLLSSEALIPEMSTALPATISLRWGERALALDQVASLEEVIASLDSIKLPRQLAAVFSERSLQHIVSLNPAPQHIARISHWLAAKLRSELPWGCSGMSALAEQLLVTLRNFARFFKELPPVLENWLGSFLIGWNGVHGCDDILDLVSYLRPLPWEALKAGVLDPLMGLFHANGVAFQVRVLHVLKTLASRWLCLDWEGWAEAVGDALRTADRTGVADPPETLPMDGWVFGQLNVDTNYWRSMYNLIAFVDKASSLALLTGNSHAALQDAVLAFFETYVSALQDLKLPFLWVPSPGIVYPCLLSPSPLPISRIAGVLNVVKSEFKRLRADREKNARILQFDAPVTDRTSLINAYILDITNTFYRLRAFQSDSLGILFKTHPDVNNALNNDDNAPAALSIVSNVAFASMAETFLSDVVAQAGPQGPGADIPSLQDLEKGNLKVKYLDYLRDSGLDGLHAFLHSSINSLAAQSQPPAPSE